MLAEVVDLNIFPVAAEVFGDEAAVAVVGLLFAAEEAGSVEEFAGCKGFDGAGLHEVEETALVGGPVALELFVGVQYVLGGGEIRGVDVVDVADGAGEEAEVFLLGEAGELRDVIEADVDEAGRTGLLEGSEEGFSGLLGETDGVNAQSWPAFGCGSQAVELSGVSSGSSKAMRFSWRA
jgi:hypothetical protein